MSHMSENKCYKSIAIYFIKSPTPRVLGIGGKLDMQFWKKKNYILHPETNSVHHVIFLNCERCLDKPLFSKNEVWATQRERKSEIDGY